MTQIGKLEGQTEVGEETRSYRADSKGFFMNVEGGQFDDLVEVDVRKLGEQLN